MREKDFIPLDDVEFEDFLSENISDLPPEDETARSVNPWRRGIRAALAGMALNSVTLNFWGLDYILPTVGVLLMLLGFRGLRRVNRWFAACYWVTVVQTALTIFNLSLNATIWRESFYAGDWMPLLNLWALAFPLFRCFALWRGLREVRTRAGLEPGARPALMLLLWYVLLILCADLGLGLVTGLVFIAAYFLILRSLWKVSKELDEAGYLMEPAPVHLSDGALSAVLAVALAAGILGGWALFHRYPMDWTEREEVPLSAEAAGLRENLLELGFPDYVLDDLTEADILSCKGAERVEAKCDVYPMNRGRHVEQNHVHTTVFDHKELQLTGVAVKLPGERENWLLFHHFLWVEDVPFYGTESIQFWTADHLEGWGVAGDFTGRVLYDKGNTTYTAPYWFLGMQSYTSDSLFFGRSDKQERFAAFSMPLRAERARGYVVYPVMERQDGCIMDSWMNYTHPTSPLQYPVLTAMQMRMKNGGNYAGVFVTAVDAIQFYPNQT